MTAGSGILAGALARKKRTDGRANISAQSHYTAKASHSTREGSEDRLAEETTYPATSVQLSPGRAYAASCH